MDNQVQHKQRHLVTLLGPVADKTFFTSHDEQGQLSIYRGLVKQSNVARVETTNSIITLFDTTYTYMCRLRHKVSLLSTTDHVILRISENSPWSDIPTYVLLAYSRGFSSVIVIVNYADAATYSRQIHENMSNKILDATNRYYTYDHVTIIPLIMQQDFQAEYPDWYRGTTLIQALDNLPARTYGIHKDSFRMIIQKSYKQVLVGRVCSGSINVRDPLVCQFSGRIGNIQQDGKRIKVARTGDYVGIILQYCSRSDRVVFAHGKLPSYTNTFIVQVQVVENRLQVGRVFLVCAASYYRNCKILRIFNKMDRHGRIVETDPTLINTDDIICMELEPIRSTRFDINSPIEMRYMTMIDERSKILAVGSIIRVNSPLVPVPILNRKFSDINLIS